MRKLLLASGALVVLCSPSAMAADVLITSTVQQACLVSADANATLPSNGTASAPVGFSWQCNYGTGFATITFDSQSGGVTDGVSTYVYDIAPSTGSAGDSATNFTNTPNVNVVPNTPVPSTMTLQLDNGNPILVAGTYTDTLHVTIAP